MAPAATLTFLSGWERAHHFLRKPERPFHIDFCFVPQAWAEQGLAVQLVNDEPWRRLSDHFPLVVDVGHESDRLRGR